VFAGFSGKIDRSAEFIGKRGAEAPTSRLPDAVKVLVASKASLKKAMRVYRPVSAALLTSKRTIVGLAAVDLHSFLRVKFLHDDNLL